MKGWILRLASNFLGGFCVCSAVVNVTPVHQSVVPVTVFYSDGTDLTTKQSYELATEAPQLFQFYGQD